MWSKIYGNVLMPPLKRLKGSNELKYFRELERSQRYSREELEDIQGRKLQALLKHAYRNVPYYHDLFKRINLRPADIKSPRYFRNIPILTKEAIQNNLPRLIATNFDNKSLIKNATGGSTGQPLMFYQDTTYWEYNAADKTRHLKMMSINQGDKCAYLWGAERDAPQLTTKGKILQMLNGSLWLNSFNLTEDLMFDYVKKLKKIKAKAIIGYASSLYLFAKFVNERGITGFNPKSVQSSAEKLFNFQRQLIESTFNCKVFDRYGCREVGNIAHECEEHKGLHISSEIQYVEFIRDNEPITEGEIGDIVVTNLTNYAMPFIRYKIGDIGSPVSDFCNCGRSLPLMKPVEGRITDIIVTPAGKYIHGEYFSHLFYNIKGVKQFQILQESMDKLIIKIVPTPEFNEKNIQYIEDEIKEWIDKGLDISFQFVEYIPATESGKYRFTISKVPLEFRG